MFVARGAKAVIMAQRKERFVRETVAALVQEAAKLGISKEELLELIKNYEGGQKQ